MPTVSQIIAAINPKYYSPKGEDAMEKQEDMKKFKALIKSEGIIKAAEKANPKPAAEHRIVYDSASETLEPVYFWILDFLESTLGFRVEKLVDNFTSSPGSGHFSELGQKASVMQQQASKIMGDVNTVLRSVLNLIYDLKEFRLRLSHYDDLKSKDKGISEGARLALKQVWMDKVDTPQKGNSSIKAMALGQAGYQTLIDAFLVANDEKDVDTLDLNDRVKRILKPRIWEFNKWVDESEKELRKRYALEKNYLKSQVNSLKIYARWVKPYLRASQKLEQKDMGRNPALVNVFSTIVMELTVFAKAKYSLKKDILSNEVSKSFLNYKQKREYYSCVVVDFTFRGIPQKSGQHYIFGGKADVSIKAFALNDDEIKLLTKKTEESDVGEILSLIEGSTGESLEQIQEEIDFFLNEKDTEEEKKEEKKKSSGDESNPFLALIGHYDKVEKKEDKKPGKEEESEDIRKDDWVEETMRKRAEGTAKGRAFLLFDVYKKAHGMVSYT